MGQNNKYSVASVMIELTEEELQTVSRAMKVFTNTDIAAYTKNALLRFAQDELSISEMFREVDMCEEKCVRYDT